MTTSITAVNKQSIYTSNIQENLDAINAKLPPGIRASVLFNKGQPLMQFSVRYEHKGKKYGLGTFMTLDGAVTALLTHKYRGLVQISKEELEARTTAMFGAVDQRAEVAVNKVFASNDISMEKIAELLEFSGTHDKDLGLGNDIERMDANNTVFLITVQQQSDYLAWKFGSKDSEVEQPAIVKTEAELIYEAELERLKLIDPEEYARLTSE